MTRKRADSLILLMLGAVIFLLGGVVAERSSATSMADFKVVYCGSRCLIEHRDPYKPEAMEHVFKSEIKENPTDSEYLRHFWHHLIAVFPYLPTAWLLTFPFALLPSDPAIALWMTLIAVIFLVAAYLTWTQIGSDGLLAAALLMAQFLASSRLLLAFGNPAGLVVSLCVVSVWCFIEARLEIISIVCLAASLVIKPHDTGFVWLFFVLAGGRYRKLAWQTLIVTIALGLPGVAYAWKIAPHWVMELHRNMAIASSKGGLTNAGSATVNAQSADDMLVNLQTLVSMIWNKARFYNLVSYGVCGALLLVWGIATVRSQRSAKRDWMALAVIAALSMLPVYHRQHDTRLLLLVFPAFAMLWSERGAVRWIALAVTEAGVLATAGLTPRILRALAERWHLAAGGVGAKILNVVMIRPAPIALLGITIFYLWVYVRYVQSQRGASNASNSELAAG